METEQCYMQYDDQEMTDVFLHTCKASFWSEAAQIRASCICT